MGATGSGWAHGHGLTLVEALVVLTIVALLASLAAAELSAWQQQTRLRATADLLAVQLRHAQSEAQRRQATLTVNVRSGPWGWCIGLREETPCDCTLPGDCTLDGIERVQRHDDHPGVTLSSGLAGQTLWLSPRRGTASAGNFTLSLSSGHAVRVVVNGLGRVRLCLPPGSPTHGALPEC